MEGSAIPDGVLELSTILEGMAHILMVRALGVEDVVQRALASARSSSGARGRRPGGVYFFARPLLPALVGLLVHVAPWCGWSGLCSSDEVLGTLIGGDVEVCLSKQLFEGGRRFLQYGSDEGRVIGSSLEVLDHGHLRDLGDTISHGLEPFEVRPESLVPPTLDGFEVPRLRWFVGEGLEVGGEASTEVAPIVDAVSG